MIVVMIADPNSGAANMSFEGGPPEMVYDLMYQMIDNLGKKLGKPPLPKQSGLVAAPPSAVPDFKQQLDKFKQRPPE